MWGRSIIERLGFRRPVTSTRKVEVLEETEKETRFQHHFRIVNIIEKHNIPKFHLLNSVLHQSMLLIVALQWQKMQLMLVWL